MQQSRWSSWLPAGEPCGEGAPGAVGAEPGAPEVEAAGGGVGGADLGHGEAHGEGEGAGDGPAVHHGDGPAELEARPEQRRHARHHRHDREAHREVGHHPEECRERKVSLGRTK